MPEWEQFEIDINNAPELTTVRHIAHAASARRIIEDGRIKAGLVYDQSKLNTQRLSVTWVSANTWGMGSIYGTVEFRFSWADLIASQRIYWVEAMEDYRPPAYRLLLSHYRIIGDLIKPYDPRSDQGPLRYKDRKFYWNDKFTSEFMIDDDLSLDRCTGFSFVQHHAKYCRPFGNECEERLRKPSSEQTGSKMLAFILGYGVHVLDKHLRSSEFKAFTPLEIGYRGLIATTAEFAGSIGDSDCRDVVRAALTLYGSDQADQARKLLALISSKNHYVRALKEIIRAHFSDPTWKPTPVGNSDIPF